MISENTIKNASTEKKKKLQIAPSILASDFVNLRQQIVLVEKGGADWLHCDVMDGRFVPNITIGPPVIRAIKSIATIPLDVHLMIVEPERYILKFIEAGAQRLTIHQEATPHLHCAVHSIKEHGVEAGIAINPSTPIGTLSEIIRDIDLVLIMSVNPGFGAQEFIKGSLRKISEVSELIRKTSSEAVIEVDGGINLSTIGDVARAGTTIFVAGTAIFGEQNISAAVHELRVAAEKAISPI